MNLKIKLLKLSLVFGFLFFIGMQDAASKQIWSLTQTNKGLFGYRNVDWYQGSMDGTLGWVGNCSEPGLSRCKTPRGISNVLDPTDEAIVDALVEMAELRIGNGSRGGHETRTVQVQGESFTRVYRITWTATDIVRRPDEFRGDGQTISMAVDREDVGL